MGTLTQAELEHRSSPRSIQKIIEDLTAEKCLELLHDNLQALILTGSFARGEGSVKRDHDRWKVLGDVEFLLVMNNENKEATEAIPGLERAITHSLQERSIDCEVVLSPVSRRYLRTLPPHIFGYELRTHGKILTGDPALLSLIPKFPPSSIPQQDGWRMLCNRLIELVEKLADDGSSNGQSSDCYYRVQKLYLDMATSYLIFAGHYKSTYQERSRELAELMASGSLPIPIRAFAHKVELATNMKLNPDDSAVAEEFSKNQTVTEAIKDAEALWYWELLTLIDGSGKMSTNRELIQQLCEKETFSRRLRGWLYVLRASGWFSSWKQWPRWFHLLFQGSPRSLIYGAGCEMAFWIGSSLDVQCVSKLEDLLVLRHQLPIRSNGTDWRRISSDIACNYHRFVKNTRA